LKIQILRIMFVCNYGADLVVMVSDGFKSMISKIQI